MRRGPAFETMVDRYHEADSFEDMEALAAQAQTEYEDRADAARKGDWK